MLAAVQGIISGNAVYSDDMDLQKYNGRTVTIIINEPIKMQQTDVSNRIGIAKGRFDVPEDFDEWDDEILREIERSRFLRKCILSHTTREFGHL